MHRDLVTVCIAAAQVSTVSVHCIRRQPLTHNIHQAALDWRRHMLWLATLLSGSSSCPAIRTCLRQGMICENLITMHTCTLMLLVKAPVPMPDVLCTPTP